MADAQWFAIIDGAEAGPYSAATLKGLAKSGKVGPTTQVKRAGMTKYVSASSVKGLLPVDAEPGLSIDEDERSPRGRSPVRRNSQNPAAKFVAPGIIVVCIIAGILAFSKSGSTKAAPSSLVPSNYPSQTATDIPKTIEVSYTIAQVEAKAKSIIDTISAEQGIDGMAGAHVMVSTIEHDPGNSPTTLMYRTTYFKQYPAIWGYKDQFNELADMVSHCPDWAGKIADEQHKAKQRSDDERDRSRAVFEANKQRVDEHNKKSSEQQAALSASMAKESDDRKIAAGLKTAQDAHDAVLRLRDSYKAALTQFEQAVLGGAAAYADRVRFWLSSQSQTDKNNRWTVVISMQKEYAGYRMDDFKGIYSTKLDHLKTAIKKMVSADTDSIALGNKSTMGDDDKADPIDAPVFDFVLPVAGDKDPIIFRNRGKDVHLSELKK